jgi:formylglycine-generating enzyme required for sulfatase activity
VGAAVLKGRYRPVTELRPNLPAALDDWFAKALSVDPAGRFSSAREMIDKFPSEAAGGEASAASIRPPEPIELPGPPEFRPSEAALATTLPAPIPKPDQLDSGTPTAPGGTAEHAPLVRRPDDRTGIRAARQRKALIFAAVLTLAGGVGAAVGIPGRSGAAACLPGMVLVEGATFAMGSAPDAETPSDETPRHAVTVKPFCLDVTEVTVAAYASCTSCDALPLTVEFEGLTPNGRTFESQFCNRAEGARTHPVNCVDWGQARAYCKSLGRRLPTEAEWELAARGKEGRTYPWGEAPPSAQRLNACGIECSRMLTERRERAGKGPWPAMYGEDDAAAATAPVGRYRSGVTPAGVLDLAGNVWEWTESPYCPYGKEDCGDSRRVLRGGGWDTTESQDVRAARRYPSAPTARGRSIGFRCAVSP